MKRQNEEAKAGAFAYALRAFKPKLRSSGVVLVLVVALVLENPNVLQSN
jgi:hypothetical protein